MRPAVRCFGLAAPLLLAASVAHGIEQGEPRSGIAFASPETRAMQADDTANPGLFWVLDGEQLWAKREGAAQKSCGDCHGAASASMKGIAARYPAFDDKTGQAVDLTGRINLCRTRHQQATPLPHEGKEMLALTAFVGFQSRGLPMAPPADPRLAPARAQGEALFTQRMGQLDLSCANCHEANWQGRLGGSPITQGQSNAYPLYRLEWQGLGSLQRRMRACMVGVRAEPFDYGAPEFVALEAFLATRAKGLPVETPGVRP
ncbi:SoxAX cytochrome complex subunit A [Azorhizobium oxalatiphilum]|uniref:SoxAX cytochrome complex subunit A n=1 Tax=Azorhizobium oxalatiphilum TaxID=980631 RepID=A0A917C976_9HYPH|nr:sulfur oxidation c-type cytochrome SoxA [Azorhizobium oxalatiphilum]GGF73843.1 SoxAX cytochrome complex subunit A [Azorhizobium oxalatiphilum]